MCEIEGARVTEYPSNPFDPIKGFSIRIDRLGLKKEDLEDKDEAILEIVNLPKIVEPDWGEAGVVEWRNWRYEYWLQEWMKGNPDATFVLKAYQNFL